MDYGFEHNGAVYTSGKTPNIAAAENAPRNASIEAAELAAWARRPDHFYCYVTPGSRDVMTWLGTRIGTVESLTRFKTNLSREITAITVRGTNGATYHGRFGSERSYYCKLTKCKDI